MLLVSVHTPCQIKLPTDKNACTSNGVLTGSWPAKKRKSLTRPPRTQQLGAHVCDGAGMHITDVGVTRVERLGQTKVSDLLIETGCM